MKRCELCKGMARMYCQSDQASLCWDCDAKVHSANFLVARHSRSLLCHACQSPLPWSASGAKLALTFSVCEKCVNGTVTTEEEDDDESNVEDDVETDEDEENQVVPWSSASPPPASSSSSEGSTISEREVRTSKRMREEVSNDDHDCASSQPDVHASPFATSEMAAEEVEIAPAPAPAQPKVRKTEADQTDRVGYFTGEKRFKVQQSSAV